VAHILLTKGNFLSNVCSLDNSPQDQHMIGF
jgi:hypothetical protein